MAMAELSDARWTINARRAMGVQVGDHGVQVNQLHLPPRPVTWPIRVGVLPAPAQGRLDRLADAQLASALVDHHPETLALGQVLTGSGGVGKTQAAAVLADRWWREGKVDLLVWVTAASRTALIARYAQAAAEVTGVVDPDSNDGAVRFLAWLASTPRRWLVVLDDLIDPADLRGLWPPTTPSGNTVVTTRRRDAALLAGRNVLDVGLFTPDEATQYLRSKLSDQPHRLDEADALARDLGYLPLALAQAAAYLVDQDLTCSQYRQRLRRRRLHDLAPHALPDDHAAPVGLTWNPSIDAADRHTRGVALPVLELAAQLDPNGIPAELFTTNAVITYLAERVGRPIDDGETHDALRLLHRLSLASLDSSGRSVRVHAMLQRVVREATSAVVLHTLAEVAADALLLAWPAVEVDGANAQAFRANTAVLHALSESSLVDAIVGVHPVLLLSGGSLGEAGLAAAARDYFQSLHKVAAGCLGPDHPHTLITRGSSANWLGKAGDAAGAAYLLAQLLADLIRVVGPDHPYALEIRGRLANWQGTAGDPAGAARELQELLTDQRRLLAGHNDLMVTRSNLSFWRGQAGDAAGAVAAFEELLVDRQRVLGPDHPDTLATRGNLAHWRGQAGDAAGAVAALQELLVDRLRLLGPDHPGTLLTRGNLAYWRGELGDAAGAAAAFEELLVDRLRVLGPDHPETLGARHNIANWRGRAGDAASAADLLQELLPDRVQILGSDHPETLATRHNLATWRGAAGDVPGAIVALRELLPDLSRVLGPTHPDVLFTRNNLAGLYGQAGEAAGAAEILRELLPDQERVLGADHPDVLRNREALAYWHIQAGEAAGAVAALQLVLADRARVLGPDHPHTLAARGNLAHWQGEAGDAAGAAKAFAEVLAERLRVLGPDHPHCVVARGNLAYWREQAGDASGAASAYAELYRERVRLLGLNHLDTQAAAAKFHYWRTKASPQRKGSKAGGPTRPVRKPGAPGIRG